MARDSGPDVELWRDDTDTLITGEAVALDLRPTGFALRAAGSIIDFLAYLVLYILIIWGGFTIAGWLGSEGAVYPIIAIGALVLCIVVVPVAVETLSRGKSLGRLAVGSRIVRDDGGAAGLRHAAIRALVGVLEIYFTLGGVAAITGLLTTRTRRLGDLLAGTYAQYERVAKVPPPVFGVPVPLVPWAATADVARMPDALSRRIAQFLAQAPRFSPDRRAYLARELASEAALFVSPVPQADAELFLAAVTVVRREREAAALRLEAERMRRLEPALKGSPHAFPRR